MNNEFYLIWNPNGHAPTFQHMSWESAKNEAERLSRLNPGHCFHVLKLVATCTKQDVQWTQVDDGIPF